ncbi:MAG: hypothetical protein HMLKMBBP_00355 [Planctomycetes bacterium]|nr:hypothetical protein [Planctomycetota bacterium]
MTDATPSSGPAQGAAGASPAAGRGDPAARSTPPNAAAEGGRARLLVLLAALLFSTGGAAIKLCALPAWQVAGGRSAFAAVAVALMVPSALRGWTWRTFVVGAAYAAMILLFALSNKMTTAAQAIFLQSTAPLYLLVLSPLLLRERITRGDLVYLAALAAGAALLFTDPTRRSGTAPDPALGNILAAGSGLAWALTVAGLRWLARASGDAGAPRHAAVSATIAGNLIACMIALPFALPLVPGEPSDWIALAYLGSAQVGLAYVCLTAGVRSVTAFEAALLLLVEPVLNPIWAWIVHGEQVGGRALWGAAAISAATVVHALSMRRSRERT